MEFSNKYLSPIAPETLLVTLQNYLDHLEKQVELANTKASLLLATVAIVITAAAQYFSDHSNWLTISHTLAYVSFGLLGISLILLLIIVFPAKNNRNKNYDSLFYYASVLKHDHLAVDYRNLTYEEAIGNFEKAIKGKASWLKNKFFCIQLAILFLGSSIIIMTLAFLL